MTSCEPDVKVTIDVGSATPDDPDYTNGDQWDLPLVTVPQVWAQGQYGSKDVKVCMVRWTALHCLSLQWKCLARVKAEVAGCRLTQALISSTRIS